MSPLAAEQEARRVCREPGPDHAALLAVLDGEVVGCGTYERAGTGSRSAEVAFTVADDLQNRGIGDAAAGAPGLAGPRPGFVLLPRRR